METTEAGKTEKPVAPDGDNVLVESLQPQTAVSLHDGKLDHVTQVAADMVHAAEEEFTEEQFRKVRRKVDWVLLPLMWVSDYQDHKLSSSLVFQGIDKLISLVRFAPAHNMRIRSLCLPKLPLV